MAKVISIKSARDFQRLYRRGKSAADKNLVVYARPNKLNKARLGITVSTKVGNAVTRNKIRRRIRESYRIGASQVKVGVDIVVIARTRASGCRYGDIDASLWKLLGEVGVLEK